MFEIGSHDTMTYLPPKKWYIYPFRWIAQCQSKTLKYQFELGVRYFDIRVRYTKDGIPEFAHGLISYKGDVVNTLKELNDYGDETQVRLILEFNKEPKDIEFQEECFRKDCKRWVRRFKNLKFHCGRRKYDWEIVYHFKNKEPELDQQVSSMQGSKLDDIFPFWYALTHNEDAVEKGTDKKYLLLDFLHIY